MTKRICILAPYPIGQAPSQRFRFEQYIPDLEKDGYSVEIYPFLSEKNWAHLYKNGSLLKKAWAMISSLLGRMRTLVKLRKADKILIHREASMIGPPVIEWVIAKLLRKRYIFDFDDAIWLPNYSESNAAFHRLKAYGKIKRIIKWSDKVFAGNDFLADYARQFTKNVHIIPTTIDLENVHNIQAAHTNDPPIIGWTGSHTTLSYIEPLLPVLEKLQQEIPFRFHIIANLPPNFGADYIDFIPWNKESEIQDLSRIDIGIMPLEDTIWARGKCGFKGLQYMALGIPAVMSPVGVNTKIVKDMKNGMLCSTDEEWYSALKTLLTDRERRIQLGQAGRETVLAKYSVQAYRSTYLKLINE